MTDPQRPTDRPRRADPLQPDKPGSGRDAQHDDEESRREASQRDIRRQEEQSDTALDNVRKGYD